MEQNPGFPLVVFPSSLPKLPNFGTSLALASFLSTYNTNLRNLSHQVTAFGLMLFPMLLILLQPDFGSALVFFSFLVVLYREGLSPSYYVIGAFLVTVLILSIVMDPPEVILGLAFLVMAILAMNFKQKTYVLFGVLLCAVASVVSINKEWLALNWNLLISGGLMATLMGIQWAKKKRKLINPMLAILVVGAGISYATNFAFYKVLKPYQQDRINVWLRPSQCDPQGSLYNLLQSKMAISSGGVSGKGFLKGTMTKFNYVPEQSTDFIFCTIGEEQGFVGSFGIIGLFLLLFIRITILAERQRSNFSRHYAYCVVGIFFFHFMINIGMTMGLMPVIGIPLPLISKGGSSLLGFTIMIAVLLKLDSKRFSI